MLLTVPVSTITMIAWWVFLLAAAASLLFGAIFSYHWFRYGASRTVAIAVVSLYALGCCLLLLVMFFIAVSHV